MHGQHALAQRDQVQDRDQQRNRCKSSLTHDLARLHPNLRQGDLHLGAGLVFAAQDQKCIVRESGIIHTQIAHGRRRQAIDKANDQIGVLLQPGLDRPELAGHRSHIAGLGIYEPDAGDPVQIIVHDVISVQAICVRHATSSRPVT